MSIFLVPNDYRMNEPQMDDPALKAVRWLKTAWQQKAHSREGNNAEK